MKSRQYRIARVCFFVCLTQFTFVISGGFLAHLNPSEAIKLMFIAVFCLLSAISTHWTVKLTSIGELICLIVLYSLSGLFVFRVVGVFVFSGFAKDIRVFSQIDLIQSSIIMLLLFLFYAALSLISSFVYICKRS